MRKHKGDFSIIVLMLILMAIGLLVMYTIGPVRANFLNAALGEKQYYESYFFVHQLISVGLSLLVFFLFAKFKLFKYQNLQKWSTWLLLISFFACALVAIGLVANVPFAKCELGGCRWLMLGPISLQPAEFVKFSLILYLAAIFTKYRGKGAKGITIGETTFGKGLGKTNVLHNVDFLWRFVLSVGISLFFVVVLQKDLGSGVPIAVITLFMIFQSGTPWRELILIGAAAFILGVGAIMTSPHRRERLWTYLGMGESSETTDEEEDADAYHIENALIAIGTGGLFGVGIGNSVQATGYLPESINDSVFAIMGETFGFIKLVAVLVLFAWLLMRILKVADYSSDNANSMIAIGAFAWVMTQVVVNVMAMTKIIPLTGITLPLLSYGGTSMMAIAGILGVVYQLSQYTSREVVTDEQRKKEIAASHESMRRVEYEQLNYRRRR